MLQKLPLGSGNPTGHPLTCKAVPAPQHAREAEARRTRGMHEAEQCAGLAEGFEEECEHLGRRVLAPANSNAQVPREGAGRNFLGELWKGISNDKGSIFYLRYVSEAITRIMSATA